MKTSNMNHDKPLEGVPLKAARIAGILFIFNLLVPTLSYVFIQSRLFVKTSNISTSANIIDNSAIFSMGIISEVVLAMGLVALGYSLFLILRQVNQNAAYFAFILKAMEATLVAVVTMISFLVFQMLLNSNSFETFQPQQIKSMAGFVLNQYEKLNSIPMILLGIEMVIFSVLFVQSRFIPQWISYFGIFSFSLIFIYGILSITTSAANLSLLTLPSFIFELICGGWLLIKGISLPKAIYTS